MTGAPEVLGETTVVVPPEPEETVVATFEQMSGVTVAVPPDAIMGATAEFVMTVTREPER